LEENKKKEGVIALKSGLQYKVLKQGAGKYHPKKSTTCQCHYAGTTLALTENAWDLETDQWDEFDSSYKRGEPTSFAPNQVIKGWNEALQLMVEGDKWELYIPPKLGYGDAGAGDKIKSGDLLIFRLEMLKIEGEKVRAIPCNLKTGEDCDDEERGWLEEAKPKSIDVLSKEVANLKAKLKETLKAGVREKTVEKAKLLGRLLKARQTDGEL